MGVPTIALYAGPPSSICSTHPCQINAHSSFDFETGSRSSSSASASSASQKPGAGGLSCLFSASPVRHVSSTTTGFSGCGEELGSLWHDMGEDLSSSFRYSSSKYLGSSLTRDSSPVSVFQGPVSCCSTGVGSSAKSPPIGISREKSGEMNFQSSIGVGSNGFFNGFLRNASGSYVDVHRNALDVSSSAVLMDELTFDLEDGFVECHEPYARDMLLGAQIRHKIFLDEFVIKAFYEAEKAHRGQVWFHFS